MVTLGTLASGTIGYETICLEKNKCYTAETGNGEYWYELAWEMCGHTGFAYDEIQICTDNNGFCSRKCLTGEEMFEIQLLDSYGDGWNYAW